MRVALLNFQCVSFPFGVTNEMENFSSKKRKKEKKKERRRLKALTLLSSAGRASGPNRTAQGDAVSKSSRFWLSENGGVRCRTPLC